jgi:hypothetical protein
VGEAIAAPVVILLEMDDDGLNGGTLFELALDLRREAALLAASVDLELVIGRGVVAAIAGDAAIEDVADIGKIPRRRSTGSTGSPPSDRTRPRRKGRKCV